MCLCSVDNYIIIHVLKYVNRVFKVRAILLNSIAGLCAIVTSNFIQVYPIAMAIAI